MALKQSTQAKNRMPIPNADAAMDIVPIFADYTMDGTEASGDIVEMVPLPANYAIVDSTVDNQALGTTVTTDVGILSGNWLDTGARTQGAEINTGKALGTAGITRMDVAGATRLAPATNDRSVGLKMTTVSAPTAGQKVRLTLFVRPMVEGV